MNTFTIIKSKPVEAAKAVKQIDKLIAREIEAKHEEDDVTNTTRARINDDVLSQLEVACKTIRESLPESKASMW